MMYDCHDMEPERLLVRRLPRVVQLALPLSHNSW